MLVCCLFYCVLGRSLLYVVYLYICVLLLLAMWLIVSNVVRGFVDASDAMVVCVYMRIVGKYLIINY